eukprot:scaffold33844_cov101-Isochrysis_galbana.AAC.8
MAQPLTSDICVSGDMGSGGGRLGNLTRITARRVRNRPAWKCSQMLGGKSYSPCSHDTSDTTIPTRARPRPREPRGPRAIISARRARRFGSPESPG